MSLLCTAVSVFVMLVLPYLVSRHPSYILSISLYRILFRTVNPIYSVVLGLVAGMNTERLWFMPIIPAAVFLLGVWLLFDISDFDYFIYAEFYLVIGIITMLIVSFIRWKKEDAANSH